MSARSRGLALVAMVLVGGLAACGGGDETTTESASAQPAGPTPVPTPTPIPAQTLSRPVIVQVENAPAARPQAGLSAADIVIEYEVEGGLTRFSAVYLNQPPGQVGPVRSARTITVQLTTLDGAALVYSGAGSYVLGLLRAAGLAAYDENNAGGNLFRIPSRAAPHNLYTDGPHLSSILSRVAGSSTLALPPRAVAALPPGGTPATRVAIPVTVSEQPVYSWDAAAGGWTRTEPDTGRVLDTTSGRPWTVPTVAVLQVPVTPDPQVVDAAGGIGVDHAIRGTGPAEILVGGRVYTGRFTQGPSGLPALTLADGTPAPIAAGHMVVIYTRTANTPRVLG